MLFFLLALATHGSYNWKQLFDRCNNDDDDDGDDDDDDDKDVRHSGRMGDDVTGTASHDSNARWHLRRGLLLRIVLRARGRANASRRRG